MGQLGDLSPAGTIAVGILVGLASTGAQSIGLTLQRKSHLLEDEKEDELVRRPPYRRRRWLLGMIMFILSNLVGSTIQITCLPLPVLSTLQASGLVFNTLCASLLLEEPFTRWSLLGTVLVAGGAVLIALFGAIAEPSHTLDQLLHLLFRVQFVLWMVGTGLLMAFILGMVVVMSRLKTNNTPRIRLIRGMSFGGISGILSAHTLLVAKSAVELLVRTIVDQHNQFNRFESWLILLLLLILALLQLYFLHRGLKLCSTSVLYPFVFCIYNIVAILDGLIYFKQLDELSPLYAGLVAIGTFVLLAGVLALSWRVGEESAIGPPPDTHNFLTPGIGIVEDTTTDEEDLNEDVTPLDSGDEEAALRPTERTPLLKNGQVMTPTAKDNAILQITKPRRQRVAHPKPKPAAEAEDLDEEPEAEITRSESQGWKKLAKAAKSQRRASTMTFGRQSSHSLGINLSEGEESDNEDVVSPLRTSTFSENMLARRRSRTMGSGRNVGFPGDRSTWRAMDRERRRRRRWSNSRSSNDLLRSPNPQRPASQTGSFQPQASLSPNLDSSTVEENPFAGAAAEQTGSSPDPPGAPSVTQEQPLTDQVQGTRRTGSWFSRWWTNSSKSNEPTK